YAVGWDGTIIHYDGGGWRRLVPATNRNLHAVGGRSAGEIYVAGDKGAILLFNGNTDGSTQTVARGRIVR
ncbi:MAG TPA: hypothetical protein VFT13_11150, partial [Candidatus Krumholzibacteria bacterium]|nr:hypothetical protein [Candidatus Krumholzibacteria bacterium]